MNNRSVVALRVMGDSLDPLEITEALGSQPTLAYKKGSTRLTKLGKEVVNRSGIWSLDAEEKIPENLNSQIEEIFSKLTKDLNVWGTLNSKYRMDLFCGLFMELSNEGVALKSVVLRLAAERGVEIGLDIYAPDDANEQDSNSA